jgi:hypothetical protein
MINGAEFQGRQLNFKTAAEGKLAALATLPLCQRNQNLVKGSHFKAAKTANLSPWRSCFPRRSEELHR